MKSKLSNILMFISSLVTLLISMKLFWNMAIYVDEANASSSVVLGGKFWVCMEWIKLGLLLFICTLAAIQLIRSYKSSK